MGVLSMGGTVGRVALVTRWTRTSGERQTLGAQTDGVPVNDLDNLARR